MPNEICSIVIQDLAVLIDSISLMNGNEYDFFKEKKIGTQQLIAALNNIYEFTYI